jgi:thiol:disulfide interchange protein
MNARKVITVACLVAALGMGYYSMNAAPVVSDDTHTYEGGLEWQTNHTAALETARQQDKPVLVYYWATWCTYCDSYDSDHYRNETVRDTLDDYVLLAVNLDEPGEARALVEEHGATYPPQHRVMTGSGETVRSVNGYVERDRLLAVLESGLREAA